MVVVASHLWHGVASAFQSLGLDQPAWTRFILPAGKTIAVLMSRPVSSSSPCGPISPESGHEARCAGAGRPDPREVGPAQVRDEAGQPGQQAEVHDHRRRHGSGRRVGAASLGELGYHVLNFLHPGQPPPCAQHRGAGRHQRRQDYQNDGDTASTACSTTRQGGDYRSREANVYRLAQLSVNIIDQCVAQGVPFAREYGGLLDNRSFGGAQVSRTFYARARPGSSCFSAPTQSLMRQVHAQAVRLFARREMLDLVVIDGRRAASSCATW